MKKSRRLNNLVIAVGQDSFLNRLVYGKKHTNMSVSKTLCVVSAILSHSTFNRRCFISRSIHIQNLFLFTLKIYCEKILGLELNCAQWQIFLLLRNTITIKTYMVKYIVAPLSGTRPLCR